MNILCLSRLEHPKRRFKTNNQLENIFNKLSDKNNVIVHNSNIKLPNYFKNLDYQLIVLFSSFLSARNDRNSFKKILKEYDFIKNSNAYKVAMPQDDYEGSSLLDELMCNWEIDKLFTVCPDKWDILYPKFNCQGKIEIGYTGYINDEIIKYWEKPKHFKDRKIDIFYRASNLPANYGFLGQLKKEIAERFLNHPILLKNFKIDISTKKEDLLLGEDWYKRLGDSKFCLVAPSGSSLHDPKGLIRESIINFIKSNGSIQFKDIENKCFKNQDKKNIFTMISPRNIEAALSKTVQIALIDSYSNIMSPDVHYIPLNKDYSNIDEVIKKLKNEKLYNKIASQCKEKFIGIKELREEYLVERILSLTINKMNKNDLFIKKTNKILFYFNSWILLIKEFSYWKYYSLIIKIIKLTKFIIPKKRFDKLKNFILNIFNPFD